MVKVGFIVEGDCERIVVESANFTKFLSDCGQELVAPVIDAKGGGNLLPHNIDAFIQVLEMKAVSKIYVLTDLEEEVSADVVRDRISNAKVKTIFIAVKALEAWFLADSQAMSNWLKQQYHEPYPEATLHKPYDRLKEIAKVTGVSGPGNKPAFAKKMIKHFDFSIVRAAQHPQCPSARELVDYFQGK
ncbi:hypothetical protein PSH66_00995 [Pseudomonas sp. FP597]|uniref:hypothetical protein n=1 Tax=Pseudomonas sp. FP597 TaxID=2954096 RepID=UPI002734499F|nr:hypothetical protein [Pseudomonas sp. FP597]WLI06935.1 hypothetical protein PSH66_00995 [Pseudomonas sp. FP597]